GSKPPRSWMPSYALHASHLAQTYDVQDLSRWMDPACWLHGCHLDARGHKPKAWRPALGPVSARPARSALEGLAARAAAGQELKLEAGAAGGSRDTKSLRINSTAKQLCLAREGIVWNGAFETALLVPLLVTDVVYAPVDSRLSFRSQAAGYVVALATRSSTPEIWLLCLSAGTEQLHSFLGRLARRGCTRWDLQECFRISKTCQGQGGQGAVFRGENLHPMELPRIMPEIDTICIPAAHNFQQIAAKVWSKENEVSIRQETNFLQQAGGHPNISVMLGLFCAEQKGTNGSTVRWALIMEFCSGGDIHSHARDRPMHPQTITEMLFGVLSALIHLHCLQIVHRDVKGENVVIQRDHAVLIDFGIAAFLYDSKAMKVGVGSPGYVAPEVIQGRIYNQLVDIWSTGVLMYLMTFGKMPFKGTAAQEVMERTVADKITYPAHVVGTQVSPLIPLLSKMLDKKPRKRPSARECFEELRHTATPEALDSAAFKISMTAMMELGHMDLVDDLTVADRPRSSGGHQLHDGCFLAAAPLSDKEQVDVPEVAARSTSMGSFVRSLRHIPQFIRNVSGWMSQSSSRSIRSITSNISGKSVQTVQSIRDPEAATRSQSVKPAASQEPSSPRSHEARSDEAGRHSQSMKAVPSLQEPTSPHLTVPTTAPRASSQVLPPCQPRTASGSKDDEKSLDREVMHRSSSSKKKAGHVVVEEDLAHLGGDVTRDIIAAPPEKKSSGSSSFLKGMREIPQFLRAMRVVGSSKMMSNSEKSDVCSPREEELTPVPPMRAPERPSGSWRQRQRRRCEA
ncbi:unnamed protein product, partial [Effrenium voratum]